MNNRTLKQNFERELIFQIIIKIRRKNIDMDRARQIAKAFKPIIKSEFEIEEFLDKVGNLSKSYPEINDAFITTAKEYDSQNIIEKLTKVREELGGVN